LFFLFLISCSVNGTNQLVLIDEATSQPIEGAWVYFEDEQIVLRSDIYGAVYIPKEFEVKNIEITAKNYEPLSVEIEGLKNQYITLQIDSSRINLIEAEFDFTQADTLIGSYGKYRANNDLLFYDLEVKIDIANKFIKGKNKIQFKMLNNDNRIQIDLHESLRVDSILYNKFPLNFSRQFNSIFIDFPEILINNKTYEIEFYYSGYPQETGRFGGIVFSEDSLGNPWVFTACQGPGANVWWPNKDQQYDEPDSMNISVSVPNSLQNISNGHLVSKQNLGNEWTKYNWKISYPINNYCVALNIANYVHFSDNSLDFPIDYYVLPYHLDEAKEHFKQVVPMLECYKKHFGDYPFPRDGYKLIEVPYAGMEHQTAIAYGNLFKNGYLGRDWTGVGISTKFDFIIIHESGHEWFGNSITAADDSDAWIHEGWTTYAEAVYVECQWGYEDALKYLNGYKDLIYNREPIIGPTAVNHWPTRDMYFKGALFLNTLRSIVDDDDLWWKMIYDYSHHFRGKNIYTTDVLNYLNKYFGMNLKSIFEQYLYFAELPILQLKYEGEKVLYRWQANIDNFNMPIKAGLMEDFYFIYPTKEWQSDQISTDDQSDWKVDTDRFYIEVQSVSD
ncbi:MAG: M1 family metallopeptidase, partial [Candidatus Marinimicrobia bacterium]|nr:M1 family metallopeptidase [Candidatus Neomarinimicrobiota bacterium]